MGRSTVHYADSDTNNILKKLHNKLRPAGTPVQRVEYIIELLLLRIFEVKLKQDLDFKELRKLFTDQNENLLFSSLYTVSNERLLPVINESFFPFYASILSHARKVYKRNLEQKVQDQLVLIEEVFKNSNFTNNVKSGNLQEVISLVGELDEDRLLKTDLLGDAIESALSEQGGTKDLGLHRTPDHIRQFMVALTNPNFDDKIFDPACGTAGFLFDSFGYVLEGLTREGNWPGEKAHPELKSYFKRYFEKNRMPMPSDSKAINFYRTGIYGIEYLGMIRKMAAINLYIRGLNPQNIEHGDSLALFDPASDRGMRSVVLANPPFGAERDQEAYPNVWEEFPRESETTILFVKLMLDSLAPGGCCAVVVSEGFLTWDQTSARNLRKMLIEETNLKAIISLPQGVFVSKGGAGPKTSILLFEKNGQTKDVWFYKVVNDGYALGTNRRLIEGCQLVEALELFEKYIRSGKTPPETRHSYSIPAEWITVLDPRVKQRIETETTAELNVKSAIERKKLEKNLHKQLKDKKIDVREFEERINRHEELWKNKTLNEIAKRIEKAHLYSFNLTNYRSNLSQSQKAEWDEAFNNLNRRNGHSLDDRFGELNKSPLEKAHTALALFNVQNALEFDIIRQYLMRYSIEDLNKRNQLSELREIIESGAKYPRVRLGDYLKFNSDKIKPNRLPDTRFRVLGVSNKDGIFLNGTLPGKEINQAYYRVKPFEFCYNPYRVNVGSIGLNEFDFDNQIISGAYNVFGTDEETLLPHYLMALFKSPQFLSYVNEKAHGGVRMNFKYEYLEDWEIPLPKPERQEVIISEKANSEQFLSNCRTLLKTWTPNIPETHQKKRIGEFIVDSLYGISSKLLTEGDLPVLRMNNLDVKGNWDLTELKFTKGDLPDSRILNKGDFIFNRTNSIDLVGKSSVVDFDFKCSWAGYLIRLQFSDDLNPFYIKYLFASHRYRTLFRKIAKPAGGQANINVDQLSDIMIDWIPRSEQDTLVEEIKKESDTMHGIRRMIQSQEEQTLLLINGIWND